ncbi:MAG: DUF1674 domain-containing protein [Xanthomonadales bacterium]|nr:DUF1674 domain-containing protein [Xanthomonadales bacterium]
MSDEKKIRPEDEKNTTSPPAHRTDHEDWPEEIGGPKGPEPTRYGDWERKGRVSDF